MIAAWWSYFAGLLSIALLFLYKYSTRKFGYWKIRNVPEIKPVPFVGSLWPVLSLKTTIGEWLGEHYNKVDADYFGIYAFDQPTLVIKSPKLVKAIVQKDFDNFDDRTLVTNMDDPATQYLFVMKNPSWKRVRSKISPIFTSGKLKAMYPLIVHESEQMTDYLHKHARIPNFDAKEVCAKYSTNVISRCAFAVDAGSFKNENAEFRGITREMFGFRVDTTLRQVGSWFAPNLMKMFRVQFFHSKVINSCKRIFKEVLQSRKDSKVFHRADLIDIMLEANSKNGNKFFTDDAMVGHAIQFLLAGYETVSSTLSFALYELALNPKLQEILRAELQEFFKKENGVSYAALQDMKYLDMVVCETLRKYPALPFLDRMTKADYKVEGSDLVIEKGTPVFIPMFGLHYNPKYFPEPEKFDPERFADKSWINDDGIFYVPFGEGPRICIGERFGMLEVKRGLTAIMLKFKVEKSDQTPPFIEFEPKNVALQSKVGVPLTFIPL